MVLQPPVPNEGGGQGKDVTRLCLYANASKYEYMFLFLFSLFYTKATALSNLFCNLLFVLKDMF